MKTEIYLACTSNTYMDYHFELFGESRVTGPLDGAEIQIGYFHGSHCVTDNFQKWLNLRPKSEIRLCHAWHLSM